MRYSIFKVVVGAVALAVALPIGLRLVRETRSNVSRTEIQTGANQNTIARSSAGGDDSVLTSVAQNFGLGERPKARKRQNQPDFQRLVDDANRRTLDGTMTLDANNQLIKQAAAVAERWEHGELNDGDFVSALSSLRAADLQQSHDGQKSRELYAVELSKRLNEAVAKGRIDDPREKPTTWGRQLVADQIMAYTMIDFDQSEGSAHLIHTRTSLNALRRVLAEATKVGAVQDADPSTIDRDPQQLKNRRELESAVRAEIERGNTN